MADTEEIKPHVKDKNKQKFYAGFVFIAVGFVGIIGILYIMVNTQRENSEEILWLNEEMDVLDAEIEVAERKADDLEQEVGMTLKLEKLLKEAEQVYGDEEKARREGYLWIDRKAKTWIVTLGAVNGLTPGRRLTVYDGDERVGFVKVQTPLDVISYVEPERRYRDEFESNHYRIVAEEE